jgi:hypothetical protein
MSISTMLSTHPTPPQHHYNEVVACVDACFDCAAACTSCADACLSEHNATHLKVCITINLACADVCIAAGRTASRLSADEPALFKPLLAACIAACHECAEECERHSGMHEHCRVCAEVCRRCAQACGALADVQGGALTAGA